MLVAAAATAYIVVVIVVADSWQHVDNDGRIGGEGRDIDTGVAVTAAQNFKVKS